MKTLFMIACSEVACFGAIGKMGFLLTIGVRNEIQ